MKILKCEICGKEVEVVEGTTMVICSTCLNKDKGDAIPQEVIQKIHEKEKVTNEDEDNENNETDINEIENQEIEKIAEEIIGNIIEKPTPNKTSRSQIIKDLLKQGKSNSEILVQLKELFPEVPDKKLYGQISVIKSTEKKLGNIKVSSNKTSRSRIIKDLLKQGKSNSEILVQLKELFPEVPDKKLYGQISVIKSTEKKLGDIKLSSFETKNEK